MEKTATSGTKQKLTAFGLLALGCLLGSVGWGVAWTLASGWRESAPFAAAVLLGGLSGLIIAGGIPYGRWIARVTSGPGGRGAGSGPRA